MASGIQLEGHGDIGELDAVATGDIDLQLRGWAERRGELSVSGNGRGSGNTKAIRNGSDLAAQQSDVMRMGIPLRRIVQVTVAATGYPGIGANHGERG